MKAVVKEVGKEPKVIDIDNTLEALQNAVGGYIEEGKMKGKPYNFDLGNDKIVGDVLFVKDDGEEFADLTENQIEAVMQFFSRTPTN